jgi:cell division protein ZapB
MHKIEEIAERIDRLLLRYEELQRSNALLKRELHLAANERDSLKARLSAARARIDALISKLPATPDAPATSDKAEEAP